MFVIDDPHINETELLVYKVFTTQQNKRFRRIDLEELVTKSKASICRALSSLQESGKVHRLVDEGLVYYQVNKDMIYE